METLLDTGGITRPDVPEKNSVRHTQKVVRNDRTAGYMPVSGVSRDVNASQSFDNVLSSYSVQSEIPKVELVPQQSDFSFFDFIDIVNPLQHIPVVNYVYRGVTGDEIKPIGKIIGGGVFGGPTGVVSGLVDAVLTDGTGRDMVGNVKYIAGFDRQDALIPSEHDAYSDLPATLLAFAETPMPQTSEEEPEAGYERARVAQGRTAGTIAVYA